MTYQSPGGKAVTIKKIFTRETTVSIHIHADPGTIWALLTNAPDFPRWNSTIISIDGEITAGGKIQLKSKLDPKRTFKLSVQEFRPGEMLVWSGAMGNRIFTLTETEKGQTNFVMSEKIGGLLFPLFARMIPVFDQSFEQFARDLKNEAEKNFKVK